MNKTNPAPRFSHLQSLSIVPLLLSSLLLDLAFLPLIDYVLFSTRTQCNSIQLIPFHSNNRGQPNAARSGARERPPIHGGRNQTREGTHHCGHTGNDSQGLSHGGRSGPPEPKNRAVVLHRQRQGQGQDRPRIAQGLEGSPQGQTHSAAKRTRRRPRSDGEQQQQNQGDGRGRSACSSSAVSSQSSSSTSS